MLFNSSIFACFLVVVFALYWALRSHVRAQNVLLLVASYTFYGWWDVRFLFLIILATTIDYNAATLIHAGAVTWRQRLKSSLIVILAALVFVGFNWNAVSISRSGILPSWSLDPGALLTLTPIGTWLVPGAFLAVLIGILGYPLLLRLPLPVRRRVVLIGSIATNLTILGFFKYFNFFSDGLASLLRVTFGWDPGFVALSIILPVGISFFTFQSMSYTIDTFRGTLTPTRSFVTFATFIAFFPQLVAGPIERARHMIPQFESRRRLTGEYWREAIWLLLWGLFKKVVVADNMAVIANRVFAPYDGGGAGAVAADGLYYWVGLWAFTFQIYGDFSGYSDMARGLGRLFGFDLMYNFNLPYFALSPSEFWQRWHISLSSWLRDYLYVPLGGNRLGAWMTYRNLCLTMLLGGLWHGAAWTFVFWGAYHGLLLVAYRLAGFEGRRRFTVGGSLLAWFAMFQFTCLGWLLFRARNVETIWAFLGGMMTRWDANPESVSMLLSIAYYAWFLLIVDTALYFGRRAVNPIEGHWFYRVNVYTLTILSLLVLSYQGSQTFIYFAF